MTGLRKLRILDSSRHNPAVGILYGSKPLGRLLIVGLSHYGSESEVKGAGFTQAVVGAVTHPSTRKFNQNRADISNWVREFMTWTKRVPGA